MHNFGLWFTAVLIVCSACGAEHAPAGDLGTFKVKPARREQAAKQRDAAASEREDAGRPADESREDAGRPADESREDSGRPAPERQREDSGQPEDAGRATTQAPEPTKAAPPEMAMDAGVTKAATTQAQSAWTMLAYDLASTYNNSAETLLTKQNASSLRLKQRYEFGQAVQGAPLMVDGRLYFNAGQDIWVTDLADGRLIWRHTFDAAEDDETGMTNSMAYEDGKLFVHRGNSELLAFHADDGKLAWQRVRLHSDDDTYGRGYGSPIVVGDNVIVGRSVDRELPVAQTQAFRGSLWSINKIDGRENWRMYTVNGDENGAGIWSTPSADIDLGAVYVTTANNLTEPMSITGTGVLGVALTDGQMQFSFQTRSDVAAYDFGANPILFDGMFNGKPAKLMAAASKSGKVYVMNRESTELAWQATLGAGSTDGDLGVYANGAWTGKHLLFANNEGRQGRGAATLYALEAETGKTLWERELGADVIGRITVANGVGFVGAGTELVVFDVDDGSVLSVFDAGATVAGTASIANGMVAFGTGAKWQGRDDTADGQVFVLEVP